MCLRMCLRLRLCPRPRLHVCVCLRQIHSGRTPPKKQKEGGNPNEMEQVEVEVSPGIDVECDFLDMLQIDPPVSSALTTCMGKILTTTGLCRSLARSLPASLYLSISPSLPLSLPPSLPPSLFLSHTTL